MLRRIPFATFLLLVTLLPASNGYAQCTRTWQGGIDNVWFNEMNWTPTGIPTAADDVCIFAGSPLLAVNAEYTIHSLTLGEPGSGVFAELTYTETAFTGTPVFHLLANSTLNPEGRLIWQNGPWDTADGTSVTNLGEIVFETNLGKVLDSATFINQGTVSRNDGRFHLNNGSTFINEATFVWDGGSAVDSDGVGTNTFVNTSTGVFRHTDAAVGVLFVNNLNVENEGLFDAQSGDIQFAGPSTHTDAVFEAGVDGEINFGGVVNETGLHTFNGTITGTPVGVVRFTANGVGAVTAGPGGATLGFGGTGLEWRNGTISGVGGGTLTNTGLLTMPSSGFGDRFLTDGATLINQADMLWSGKQTFISGGSVLQNESTFEVQGNLNLKSLDNGTFLNTATGTYLRTSGSDSATIGAGITFDNRGLLENRSSVLSISGNSNHTDAVITATAGASVRFDEGTHTIAGTVTGAPDGNVQFNGTTAVLNAAPGGTLNFGGTGFQWGGGILESADPLTNAGLIVIVGSLLGDPQIENGTTLINQGTVTWTGDRLHVDGGSVIQNEGLIEVQADLSMDSDGGGVFANTGTFRKSAGAGSFVFLPNTTVDNLAGGVIDAAGGRIEFDGTSFNRDGATVQGIDRVDVLQGTFTNEGIFAPGASPGILEYFGNYDMTAASTVLAVEFAGLTLETEYDQLDVSGTATLGGSLDDTLLDGFFPGVGNTFVILTADGGVTGAFTNTSTDDRVYIGNGLVFDIHYNPNDVTLVADLLEADYAVTKTVDTTSVVVGDTVTFTVTITNNGPHDLTDFNRDAALRVTDALPNGLTLVSATPSAGTYDAGTGLWELQTLAVGATETLTLAATVEEAGTFINTATRTGSELPDPDDTNDAASATVTAVAPGPDVTIALTPINPPIIIPPEGGRFGFDIALTNHTDATRSFDLWLNLTGPGVDFERGPRVTTLAPEESLTHHVGFHVPAIAAAGTYTVTMSVGTFPVADESDGFTFEKTAGAVANGAAVAAWQIGFEAALGDGRTRAEAASEAAAIAAVETPGADLPDAFALEQNYPNPFNPSTVIRYALPEAVSVSIQVFDLLGRRVAVLVDGRQEAGHHAVRFEAEGLPAGVYLYAIEAGAFRTTRQMVLLK